jgi:hypothetical protein
MPFDFTTPFPPTDPDLAPRFARSFEHVDWIDGESIVQAEQTPTEEGFNSRFRNIIADLDALADDSRRALLGAAAMRASLFAIIGELEKELSRLGAAAEDWRAPTLTSDWRGKSPDYGVSYNPPGYFLDRCGLVHLRGMLGDGLNPSNANGFNSVMFLLPPGYRPPNRTVLRALTGGDEVVRVDIQQDGAVNLRSPYTTFVSLDGISFRPGVGYGGGNGVAAVGLELI